MNKQQEPRLRFQGFMGAWEDRILGKVADVRDGTHDSPIYQNQGIPLVTSKNLTENGLDFSNVSLISQEDYEEINKRSKVESGDILLGLIGTIGKPVLVKSGGYAIKNVGLIKELLEVKNEFLLPLLQSNIFETYVLRKNTGNTQKFLSLDGLRSFEFLAPNFPEQTHLGLFFRRLDSQIAESRAVLEKSRQLKKAMLAKMFPANGEKIPKIRFKGFEGEWECRKLGDLMNVTSVKRIHQSDWTNEGVRFLRARDIVAFNKGEKIEEPLFISKGKYNEYSEISGKVKIGDLLVTGVGTIGVPYLIEDEDPLYFKDGNVIWFQNENKIGGLFFYYSFLNNFIQDFIIETAGIGTVGTYTIDTGKKTPIFLPPTKSEQTAIGNFFRQLDETITLQSAEVEKLNQLKKGLLAAMLV